jgi:hypothetical protein
MRKISLLDLQLLASWSLVCHQFDTDAVHATKHLTHAQSCLLCG